MQAKRLRLQIADHAARLLVSGRESDYTTAKRRAARILGVRFSATDLPSTREIRDACQKMETLAEDANIDVDPHRMQVVALRLMQLLRAFEPRLIGPLDDPSPPTGSETTIHVYADRNDVLATLSDCGYAWTIDQRDGGNASTSPHTTVWLKDEYDVKLRIFTPAKFPQSGVTAEQLQQQLLARSNDLDAELLGMDAFSCRFEVLEDLLHGLEEIRCRVRQHPEVDVLNISLRLFDLAREERDYDEEFLTAAAFHQLGRLTRSPKPLHESRKLLNGLVTRRTLALIEGLELATEAPPATPSQIQAAVGTENAEDVFLLAALQRKAFQAGSHTHSIEDVIEHLRSLDGGEHWTEPSE